MSETHYQILKYVCVGSMVVMINVSLLYSFTEFFHIYYLISAVFAFCVAFLVSFFLQKFFTFSDVSTGRVASQMARYLSLQLAYVCVNAALLYVLVEYLGVWYILAELTIALGLAIVTFIISRRFIFVRQVNDAT
ncbi:MAG: GtrA family protein [Candidatus Parcubacteria bacterium]|nr:GtrA family protein [Candidatus Parcubacteria bacterium]